jgi:hypothetical protein
VKRPSRKSTGIAAGIAALATVGILLSVQPQAVEIGVTVYEDAAQHGDHMLTTGIAPNYPKRANLTLVTTGLSGGCNRGINQSSTWSDCISSASVSSLPANTKLIFYRDINYGFTQTCYDVDGSHNIDLTATADTISSFRIISGNC